MNWNELKAARISMGKYSVRTMKYKLTTTTRSQYPGSNLDSYINSDAMLCVDKRKMDMPACLAINKNPGSFLANLKKHHIQWLFFVQRTGQGAAIPTWKQSQNIALCGHFYNSPPLTKKQKKFPLGTLAAFTCFFLLSSLKKEGKKEKKKKVAVNVTVKRTALPPPHSTTVHKRAKRRRRKEALRQGHRRRNKPGWRTLARLMTGPCFLPLRGPAPLSPNQPASVNMPTVC